MTKENALRLIRMTVFEFHRDVMIPLDANIDLYDKMPHSSAVRLHEHFFDFSSAVQNLYGEISKAIIEDMDNFQTSQLLSLCRDISELYGLPVFKDMPGSIPDNSPIRYVDPGATDDLNYELEDNTLEKLKSQIRKFGDEELTKRLAEVESGQSRIVFEEMKDSTEGHRAFGPFGNELGYNANPTASDSFELDLYFASGTFTISTFCDVAIAKDNEVNNGIFYATGKMMHIFWDIYDWHPGLDAKVPVLGKVPDDYGDALVNAGRAAEFEMQSSWTEYGIDWELKSDEL
ncbi:MAG: hypothetical protein LBQ93_08270 [Treponema sp.]|jgi:hypothetical protein|nr:hypothetical protein [Treponema sp.]